MKNQKKISALLFGMFMVLSAESQDVHFTQIFNHDTQINPALTGNFNGNQRVNLTHKQQWGSLGPGFKTYQFSFDNGLMKKQWKNSYLGLGIRAFTDKSGDPEMRNTMVELLVSDHIYLDANQTFAVGIGGSFNQFSIGQTSLIWEDQYIPGSTSLNTTAESFANVSQNYFDLSAGLSWTFTQKTNTVNSVSDFNAVVGLSAYHLTQPKLDPILGSEGVIERKYNAYTKLYINLPGSNMAIVPSVLYSTQGKHYEVVAGALIRYELEQGSRITGFKAGFATSLGLMYRYKDAVSPVLFVEYGKVACGISYDVTMSDLAVANNSKGGFEFTLRFVNPNPFHYKNPTRGRPSL